MLMGLGLDLILDAQAEEYLPTSTQMGFAVMIHGQGFRPVLCNDVVFVEPGFVTYISLRLESRTALPEPYQFPCRSSWPSHFKHFTVNNTMYTREDCLSMCQQDYVRRQCGCESSDLPTTSNRRTSKAYPICREKEEPCIKEVQTIMGLESTEKYCKCHRSCGIVEYHKEVSRATMPEAFLTGADGNRRALARVVVHFSTVTYLKLTSEPKYYGGRVVSSFGGINGIYLGVSFFVLFGMLETFVRAVWLFLRKHSTSSRRRGTSKHDQDNSTDDMFWDKKDNQGGTITGGNRGTKTGNTGRHSQALYNDFPSRLLPPGAWKGSTAEQDRLGAPERRKCASKFGFSNKDFKEQPAHLPSNPLASLHPFTPSSHKQ